METVLITGGTGLVGTHLSKKLKEKGYRVTFLSRSTNSSTEIQSYYWDIEQKIIEKEALETADYIIHLAGANIADKRWTNKRKQELIDSRVKSAALIFEKVKESKRKPKAFISASAVGYYGMITSEKIYHEEDPPAADFLGQICTLWEEEADRFQTLKIRTVKIRSAIVLDKDEGSLPKMMLPVKLGIGSALGSGRQYMPWIHIDDLCGIYIKAIEDKNMNGAYNAVAPEHVTNKTFFKTLAKTLQKPFWFPNVPAFLLKLIFGEKAEPLLKGSRVSSEKIKSEGYVFLFPNLKDALNNFFNKK